MLSFFEPLGFKPKTSAVPVLPLIGIGNPANEPAAVPLTTTSRSALFRKLNASGVLSTLPITRGEISLTTAPLFATIARAIVGCQIVPPLAIAA